MLRVRFDSAYERPSIISPPHNDSYPTKDNIVRYVLKCRLAGAIGPNVSGLMALVAELACMCPV